MNRKHLQTPLTSEVLGNLEIGDKITLSGTVYTARDAAHKRLVELIKTGKSLPFNPEGQVIYYVGPSPAKPGHVIGSAGPTTSSRMDPYTVYLLEKGIKGMIGKGIRSQEVRQAIQKYKAVYFAAIGGAAALISKCITRAKVVAYPELGTEAIHKLEIINFPLIVVNDTKGNDLYQLGQQIYQEK